MTSASALGTQPWQEIKGHRVAICALIYFYVREESINEAGPMLSRLLSHTTRLIFLVDSPSPNLEHFVVLLSAALKPTGSKDNDREVTIWTQRVGNLVRESCSFSGLHNFFTKVERLLMTEELYDEINNITIKPAERKIDEQSPFGHFLQRCLDKYLSLEDDEFAKTVGEFQQWVEGGDYGLASGSRNIAAEGPTTISALRRGDYSLARAELEGFFDRSPLNSTNHSLQETLLKNALFHYRTKAFESARASLDESLRLSRGVNDLLCISACDNLLRRIDYEEESEDHKNQILQFSKSQVSFSLKDLWQIQRQVDLGRPLLSILDSTCDLLLHQNKGKGKGADVEYGATSEEFAECCLCQAKTWAQMGFEGNSSSYLHACIQEGQILDSAAYERLELPVAILKSQALVEEGKVNEAISILLHPTLLQSLSMASFALWQAELSRMMYRVALKADSIKTMDSIKESRPETIKEVLGNMERVWEGAPNLPEPNEASFDRNGKITLSQQLMGKLREAQILRQEGHECGVSLTISTHVMRRAEEADLFQLYRRGALECAESLLGLGNVSGARELMNGMMPQLLVERSVELRGRAAWIYARILLKLQKHKETGHDAVFSWLNRAKSAFRQCGMAKDLSDVLYVQARLCHQLNMHKEKQEVSQEFQLVIDEWNSNRQTKMVVFERVQSIIRLVGARVVAGG